MKLILINKKSAIAFFLLLSNFVFSQGLIEVPLHTNQVLISKWEEIKNNKAYFFPPSITDTISIPLGGILDDFSNPGPFPDPKLWLDCSVFVNRNYPVAPPTIGVATFDGVNRYGYPYNFQVLQTSSAIADTLTSKRIRMDSIGNAALSPADSVYLSFYYQPQGRGNAPEPHDSLVVEFNEKRWDTIHIDSTTIVHNTVQIHDSVSGLYYYTIVDSTVHHKRDSAFIKEVWQEMWAKGGSPLPADSSWKLVMIPIVDTSFFKPGFQFRFKNYATISGNGDQWSIDNVYLNKGRFWSDTILNDVAFVYDAPSLLKNYYAMPWRHYIDTNQCRSSFTMLLRNNSLSIINASNGADSIYDINNSIYIYQYVQGQLNVTPYATTGYFPCPSGPLLAIPAGLSGPSDYRFESHLQTGDVNHRNDTILHTQTFSNYFAYDDGSAESAFSLNASQLGELAVQYTTTVHDTLQAIDIYFNPLWHDASLYIGALDLKVWSDAGGHPWAEIDTINSVTPWYNQIEYAPNHFKRYHFRYPYYMSQPTTFYIGYLQHTSQEMSVGVDKNTNSQDKIFYNTTGAWYQSPYPGSLMMRPVFGTAAETSGINNLSSTSVSFSVYPNPAHDELFVKYYPKNPSDKILYSILDIYGRTILENKLNVSEAIDISSLSDGIYFITIKDGANTSSNKFIKIK